MARFVEKPDAARAAELIGRGCLWNAGMFCFRVDAGLREIERLAPEALAAVRAALAGASDDHGRAAPRPGFAAAPKISFDHAVMEQTDRALVIEAGFEWSDIGDWKAVWEQSPRDANGVAREGNVFARDVRDSYLRSDGRLLCVLGLERIAVVDTADAVLVAPIDRAQEIKAPGRRARDQRRRRGRARRRGCSGPGAGTRPSTSAPRFRVKRIVVLPGKQLSLQKHHHRAEHWVVVSGTAEVTRDGEVLLVRENESVYLPLGCVHRLGNPGRIPVEIVEVQTGAYLEEDDIVRVEDDFGRA